MIDDSPLDGLVGREFRSIKEARVACLRAARAARFTASQPTGPIGLEVRLASGRLVTS